MAISSALDVALASEFHQDAHYPGGAQPLDDIYATKDYVASVAITSAAAQALIDAIVPLGSIWLWSGSVASIPTHWHLCDGSTGTPNLTDSFVYGAGGAANPGATGGSSTQSDHSTHTHGLPTSNFITAGAGLAVNPNFPTGIELTPLSHGTNMPPYYALAYIMRVS